jgi:hypothetical protein
LDSAARRAPVDPGTLIALALREAYLDTMEDLRYFAEKVKKENAKKKQPIATPPVSS